MGNKVMSNTFFTPKKSNNTTAIKKVSKDLLISDEKQFEEFDSNYSYKIETPIYSDFGCSQIPKTETFSSIARIAIP